MTFISGDNTVKTDHREAVVRLERCDNLVEELKTNAKPRIKIIEKSNPNPRSKRKFTEYDSSTDTKCQEFSIRLERCDNLIKYLKKKKMFETENKSPKSAGRAKCPHCPKTFSLKQTLNAHIRGIHLGEFKCKFCKSTFCNEQGIKHHLADKKRCVVRSGRIPKECVIDKSDQIVFTLQKVSNFTISHKKSINIFFLYIYFFTFPEDKTNRI